MNAPPTRPFSPLGHPAEAETWLFDLDNTLYHHSIDLFSMIDRRMKAFIAGYLDLPPDEAFRVQKTYFRQYGTTLRGLMHCHGMDPRPFLDYVHDVDMDVIVPDARLDAALARLPGRKLVFTNADSAYAAKVMERLGIAGRFDAIFDIIDAGYVPKPQPEVYDLLVARHALRPPACVMVEDMARNLAPARALGMTTVWVRTGTAFGHDGAAEADWIDHATDDLSLWLSELVGEEE